MFCKGKCFYSWLLVFEAGVECGSVPLDNSDELLDGT